MEKVKYVFIDPGTTNLGLVFLSLNNGVVKMTKHTVSIGRRDIFKQISVLDSLIKSIDTPLYIYSEANCFKSAPSFSNDLAAVMGAIDAYFAVKYTLKIGDVYSESIFADTLKQILHLAGNPKAKEIVKRAFIEVSEYFNCTYHESDAFCVGAMLVTRNSKQHDKDLVEYCQLFLDYVDRIRESYNTCDHTANPNPSDIVQSGGDEEPKSNNVLVKRSRKRGVRKVQKSTNNSSQIRRDYKRHTRAQHKRNCIHSPPRDEDQ